MPGGGIKGAEGTEAGEEFEHGHLQIRFVDAVKTTRLCQRIQLFISLSSIKINER
jgi:hypothetical protein